MKKITIIFFLVVSILNNSCAVFMTSRQAERKEGEFIYLDKKLLNADLKPEFEIFNNDIKLTLRSYNTYDYKQKVYSKDSKDFQWWWLLADLLIGSWVGLINEITFISIAAAFQNYGLLFMAGLIQIITWLAYIVGSWWWANSMEKSEIIEKNRSIISDVLSNTSFSLKIGPETIDGETDERGIAFIKIDKKDLIFGNVDLMVRTNYGEILSQKIDVKNFTDLTYANSIKTITEKPQKNEPIKEAVIIEKKRIETEFKADIDYNIPKTKQVNKDGVAIIIGNKNYKNN
jgi:hypothetical protein